MFVGASVEGVFIFSAFVVPAWGAGFFFFKSFCEVEQAKFQVAFGLGKANAGLRKRSKGISWGFLQNRCRKPSVLAGKLAGNPAGDMQDILQGVMQEILLSDFHYV